MGLSGGWSQIRGIPWTCHRGEFREIGMVGEGSEEGDLDLASGELRLTMFNVCQFNAVQVPHLSKDKNKVGQGNICVAVLVIKNQYPEIDVAKLSLDAKRARSLEMSLSRSDSDVPPLNLTTRKINAVARLPTSREVNDRLHKSFILVPEEL